MQVCRLAADEIAAAGTHAKRPPRPEIDLLQRWCCKAASWCQSVETGLTSGAIPIEGDLSRLESSLTATIGAMLELDAVVTNMV
jgi:hypothetical protein